MKFKLFLLSKSNEIRHDNICLDYSGDKKNIGVKDQISQAICHGQQGNQKWWMEDDDLIRHESGLCMELLEDKSSVVMSECDVNNERQKWIWKKNEKIKIK